MKVFICFFIFLISFNLSNSQEDIKLRENFNSELSSIVGTFVASNIYLIYLSQDMIYKFFEGNNYNLKDFEKFVESLNDISLQIDDNLKKLYQIVESDKDAVLILKAIDVYQELKVSNSNLLYYLELKTDKEKEIYLTQKKELWEKIRNITKNS